VISATSSRQVFRAKGHGPAAENGARLHLLFVAVEALFGGIAIAKVTGKGTETTTSRGRTHSL
jgi:hypothetical protein